MLSLSNEKSAEDLHAWQNALDRLSEKKMSWERFLLHAEGSLLAHPVSRMTTTSEGRTVLHLAVLDDQRPLIEELRGSLSLIHRRDKLGMTALDLAKFLNRQECAEVLQPISEKNFYNQPQVTITDPYINSFERLSYLSCPIFESVTQFETILRKTKKAKQEDKIPPEKIWMGIYFDKEIQKGIHPPVSIRYLDPEIGFGVFTEKRIPPCAFVGEYTGVVQERKRRHLKDKYYCLRYTVWEMGNRNFVIDAEEKGNFTRFINHSAVPNLGLQSIYWRGLPRMIFVALKEIPAGTQLTFDYGNFFWKECSQTPKLFE